METWHPGGHANFFPFQSAIPCYALNSSIICRFWLDSLRRGNMESGCFDCRRHRMCNNLFHPSFLEHHLASIEFESGWLKRYKNVAAAARHFSSYSVCSVPLIKTLFGGTPNNSPCPLYLDNNRDVPPLDVNKQNCEIGLSARVERCIGRFTVKTYNETYSAVA